MTAGMPGFTPYLEIENWLAPDQHRAMLDWAMGNLRVLEDSRIDDNLYASEVRRSLSGRIDPTLQQLLFDRFKAQLPSLLQAFRMPAFRLALEAEIVVYADGAFFRRHIDTGGTKVRRMITGVYYFFREPRAFDGGQLRLFPLGSGDPVAIKPAQNMLVAFPSFTPHEVTTVNLPSDDLADSRFAINIWAHRVPEQAEAAADPINVPGGDR